MSLEETKTQPNSKISKQQQDYQDCIANREVIIVSREEVAEPKKDWDKYNNHKNLENLNYFQNSLFSLKELKAYTDDFNNLNVVNLAQFVVKKTSYGSVFINKYQLNDLCHALENTTNIITEITTDIVKTTQAIVENNQKIISDVKAQIGEVENDK